MLSCVRPGCLSLKFTCVISSFQLDIHVLEVSQVWVKSGWASEATGVWHKIRVPGTELDSDKVNLSLNNTFTKLTFHSIYLSQNFTILFVAMITENCLSILRNLFKKAEVVLRCHSQTSTITIFSRSFVNLNNLVHLTRVMLLNSLVQTNQNLTSQVKVKNKTYDLGSTFVTFRIELC